MTIAYPAEPLVSYQINRHLSGWNVPPLVIRAFGAHCQERTCRFAQFLTGRSILRLRFFWRHLMVSADLSSMLASTPITDRLENRGDT